MADTILPSPAVIEPANVRSLPEELTRWRSPVWSASVVLAVIPAYLTLSTRYQENVVGLWWLFAGMIGVFLGIGHIYRRVIAWTATFGCFAVDEKKAAEEIRQFAREPWHERIPIVSFGSLFTLISLFAFAYGGLFNNLGGARLRLAAFFTAVASYICALGLSSLFQLARLVRKLGKTAIRVTPHQFGVLSVGGLLVTAFVDAGAVWCLYTASATACLTSGVIPALILALPALAFFITAFFVAQTPLHDAMVHYKYREVQDVESELRGVWNRSDSEEARKRSEFLEKHLAAVLALPEWPFRWPSFVALIASSSASLVTPFLKDAFLTILKNVPI